MAVKKFNNNNNLLITFINHHLDAQLKWRDVWLIFGSDAQRPNLCASMMKHVSKWNVSFECCVSFGHGDETVRGEGIADAPTILFTAL